VVQRDRLNILAPDLSVELETSELTDAIEALPVRQRSVLVLRSQRNSARSSSYAGTYWSTASMSVWVKSFPL